MRIIGCDFHTRYQQIVMLDHATGELRERRLEHENGEARAFYRSLTGAVPVGIEATGPLQWFQRLLAELGQELWVGDAAQIRASAVRQQKDQPARCRADSRFYEDPASKSARTEHPENPPKSHRLRNTESDSI